MVSDLPFYQLIRIALLWRCVMLQWAWPSDPVAACSTIPEPPLPAQAPPRADTRCGPHHQAILRRLCVRQGPPPTNPFSPATTHGHDARAPA
jgi:hypothetical protein